MTAELLSIEVITIQEVSDWMWPLLKTPSAAKLVSLFGGDRSSCCDEAVALKTPEGQIVAVASISPEGELGKGEPTIVGMFVIPAERQKGYGLLVLTAALGRCRDRGLLLVRIDSMSEWINRMILNLPSDLRDHVNLHDAGPWMDMIAG